MSEITFKEATINELDIVFSYIQKLAEYEKMSDEVFATKEDLEYWLFEKKIAHVILGLSDNEYIGFALYFYNFSTFKGKAGLYLEDIYIDVEHRGNGFGKAFFRKLAMIAKAEGCGRMEWVCLDWNQPSIDFYLKMDAKPLHEWTTYRLDETQFDKI